MINRIARSIWNNKVVKEGVLLVVTAAGITAAQQGLELAGVLEVSDAPIQELTTWASNTVVAVLVTAIKQGSAFVLARLAGTQL